MKEKDLIELAKQARKHAYAPYSDFKVGAALATKEGKTFSGCNVENASLGLSICAERVVIAKAVSEGYKNFEQIAVVADTKDVCSPCGSCRQVLYEFNPDAEVIMANLKREIVRASVRELLPHAFTKGYCTGR